MLRVARLPRALQEALSDMLSPHDVARIRALAASVCGARLCARAASGCDVAPPYDRVAVRAALLREAPPQNATRVAPRRLRFAAALRIQHAAALVTDAEYADDYVEMFELAVADVRRATCGRVRALALDLYRDTPRDRPEIADDDALPDLCAFRVELRALSRDYFSVALVAEMPAFAALVRRQPPLTVGDPLAPSGALVWRHLAAKQFGALVATLLLAFADHVFLHSGRPCRGGLGPRTLRAVLGPSALLVSDRSVADLPDDDAQRQAVDADVRLLPHATWKRLLRERDLDDPDHT
jgi:hypothetical protein